MLNNNFIKIVQSALFGGNNAKNVGIDILYDQKSEKNSNSYSSEFDGIFLLLGTLKNNASTATRNQSGTYLAFGEGGTPASEYTLAKEFAQGVLSCSAMTKSNIPNSGVMYTSTITNMSNDDIIIGEIGLFMDFVYGQYANNQAMLGRIDSTETKELPVILKVGETKTFSFGLNFKSN